MAGLNIAEVIERQNAHPDPVLEAYLSKMRLARLLEQINHLLCDAYSELGDMDALHEQVEAKMAEQKD